MRHYGTRGTTLVFIFVILLLYTLKATATPCYVLVEEAANFDPNIIQSSSISIISRYIEKVEAPPLAGLRMEDCTYTVNLTESMDGFFISLAGNKINSIGNSKIPGMNGFTQALLRAVYRTFDSEEQKDQICSNYEDLLENDCKDVEAVLFLFNERGELVPEGSTVRENDQFNIMIQPVNTLYAYIVSLDSSGNLFKVFPNPAVTSQENPLLTGMQYFFPPKNSEVIFAFDNVPGEEKLFFLLSSTQVLDIDLFFQQLEGVESEKEKVSAVTSFENQFTTRGFKLTKKNQAITLKQADNDIGTQQKKVMAELLKGSGILVKTILLRHLP
ncbi:DUF4384 domain-containing protein [bacterium]|nr:DUF4384 domain-containing protein [bacterium]